MNKEWSNKNKLAQSKLKKVSFQEAIKEFIELREDLMQEMISWKTELSQDDFSAMPFMNVQGYHNKTIAYSIWHIMRIEDIVVNSLVRKKEEVFFAENFNEKIGADIITTGNELKKQEIADFSNKLNIENLYEYAIAVKTSGDEWLQSLTYQESKKKFAEEDKIRLRELGVVSEDENAIWLIDYWCSKDILGLIKMPLSRHWIMHIEAAIRIKNKLK
ncbi:MAG: phage head-tail adapter protein [Bacillota bacterium]|nr:phage head-tail adapter protein [Bacillota bacterium]